MFYIYDTKEKKTITKPQVMRCNAQRVAQYINIKRCGIDEIDKPEDKRRFIIKEI